MNKLDALWDYQQTELQYDKLERKLKATPARQKRNKLYAFLSEQQNALSSIQKNIDARKAAVDKLSAEVDDLMRRYELELSEIEAMKNDEECTAAEVTESRRSLEKLITNMDAARRELYDTLSWIEKAAVESKETYQKAGKAKKEYDAVRAECDEEAENAKPELESARTKMLEAAKEVDPELLERYKKIKGHHTAPMARVENDQCSGCNMSLPMATIKRVNTGTDIVECENCGRILYKGR